MHLTMKKKFPLRTFDACRNLLGRGKLEQYMPIESESDIYYEDPRLNEIAIKLKKVVERYNDLYDQVAKIKQEDLEND